MADDDPEETVPVTVRMTVRCDACGHAEDETYVFGVPLAGAEAMEGREPGKCPECGAEVTIHLKRARLLQ